jgi:hypothetical protein
VYKVGDNLGNRSNPNTDKAYCVNGHEFTQENTYYYPYGRRRKRACKTCKCNPAKKRQQHLKPLGWTTEMFDLVFAEQKGKCAICKVELTPTDGKRNGHMACADHEHIVPPKPRGILCSHCNIGIGNLQDSPEILEAAAAYLRRF